jgi:signal transduction histidine kinase
LLNTMNKSRLFTVLLFSLFFFLSSFVYATEEMNVLMKHWLTVESALNNWLNADEITPNNTTTQKLNTSLEQFNEKLKNFTASTIFLQYEGTGLLPQDSGKTTIQIAQELTASVKRIAEMDSPMELSASSLKAEKIALAQKADTIREELNTWQTIASKISTNVFSRLIYIFAVFSVFVICLIFFTLFLYRALRHSQIKEQDSSDFSRITMLTQEKERTLISAELHDTVLQDMGRLLQISKNMKPTDSDFSELAQKIITRTREICRELMPPDFSRLALKDSIIQLCADFQKNMSVECRVIIDKNFTPEKLSPQMQLQVYRIIQEALSNIEKHSEAKEVTLTVRNKEDKSLLICVTDDGIGLKQNTADTQIPQYSQFSANSMGIRGMYQRAEILGASLSFVEGAGSGLTVRLEVPLPVNS